MKNLAVWLFLAAFPFLITSSGLLAGSAGGSEAAPSGVFHPLHLSVTNITYEDGMLTIRMETFRDDWEVAYFHYHSRVIDFSKAENRQIPWFSDYLSDKFRISPGRDAEEYPLTIDRVETDGEAMTLEMHARVSSEPNSLYLYQALLTDIYPDQTNLVIFGFREKQTGIKFDVKKHDAEVMLNG